MTPECFDQWLADMKSAGLVTSKKEVAALLGVTDDTITNYSKRGGPHILALACRALIHRLEPYNQEAPPQR